MLSQLKSSLLRRFSFNHKIRHYLSGLPQMADSSRQARGALPDTCLALNLDRGKILGHSRFKLAAGAQSAHSPPLVSALMITSGRAKLAMRAIDCFLAQTYANKQLVIVEDGAAEVGAYLRQEGLTDSPQIKYWHNHGPNKITRLGGLRNQSLAMADGDYLCVWDDDDLFHPQRIHYQLSACLTQNADACFLLRLMLLAADAGGRHTELAISNYRLWEGGILVKREFMPRYPNWMRHEDNLATYRLTAKRKITALDLPQLYIYNFHDNNTWHRQHRNKIWGNATERFSAADELQRQLSSMRRDYPHLRA